VIVPALVAAVRALGRLRGRALFRATVVAASVTSLAGAACSGVKEERIGIDAPSGSEQQFGPVADFLEHRCGSLDCHGEVGRNLRVWGCEGMRLDAADIPSCNRLIGGRPTTPDEHQATYRSLVGLEPATMSQVVENGGKDPDLLTFVRKAIGLEGHAGGVLIAPGDSQDQCIVSWLQGSTDSDACVQAVLQPTFPMPDAAAE
jgi:hypothetical protein